MEEQNEVDLPLTVLPPLELASHPSDVVAGVLGQLIPVEEVVESDVGGDRVEGGEGGVSLVMPKQSPELVVEVGPSSPPPPP